MSTEIPDQASVVVVGGGVMGCSTLYHLGLHGITGAVLLERNQLTSGTTWHSAALVRGLRQTENLTRLIRYSQELYKKLEEETGQSTGWIGKGSVSIATQPERLTHLRRQENLSHLFGIEAQYISAGEAKERWPLMQNQDVLGGVWSPEDGRVSVSDLCAALVKGAKNKGQSVFEHTALEGIEVSGQQVVAVITNKGRIRCDKLVICSGLWSRDLLKSYDTHLPLWPCEHFYMLTKPIDGLEGNIPTLFDYDSCLYSRDDSGGLLVGSFEPGAKAISPEKLGKDFAFQLLQEDWEHFEPMMENALHRIPALEQAEVKTLLNGPESFVADGMFMLGETARTKGLYVGCGMNSVGVATSGGAGNALAHCIVHGYMPFALPEVNPNRFPDCFNSVEALSARAPEVLGHAYQIPFPGWQPKSARDIRFTPLHDYWKKHGAHFGQHYGWERPLYFNKIDEPELTFNRPAWFNNVADEVAQAHNHAAIFELSILGKIVVEGEGACDFLNRLCANNMDKKVGRIIYTSMLDATGGIESDFTVHRIADDCYFMYVDADTIRRDMAWLYHQKQQHENLTIRDETEKWAVLGLFGPESSNIANKIGAEALNNIAYFGCSHLCIAGCEVRAARLSFVGERGWEITCASSDASIIFDALIAAGAKPAGAYALASMRIEKRFLAYGQDLDSDVTPLDAGLDFAVDLNKPFLGCDRLLEQKEKGLGYQFLTVVLDNSEATIWGNEPVCYQDDIIGRTTSAAHGHRIGKPVAIVLIKCENIPVKKAEDGSFLVTVLVGGKSETGRALKVAAYDPDGLRMRQ